MPKRALLQLLHGQMNLDLRKFSSGVVGTLNCIGH